MPRPSTGTVEFRGNPPRWHARITTRDEHGVTHRPWVDLMRPDLTKDDKAVAKRLAAKRAKQASKMDFVGKDRAAPASVKLADLEEKWFALLDSDPNLKPGTRTAYKSCWTSRAKPMFGKHTAASLTVPALRGWIREMVGELSASTVRNNAIAFTRFLSDARAEGWIALDSNPMRHEDVLAMLPTVQAPDADAIVCWTRAECEKLLACPTLPDDRFGLYLVALLTGLRAGELRGLTFAHLVTDAPIPVVRVVQQRGLARAAGETTTNGTPKTRSGKRDVPLHPHTLAWLTWWRDEGWSSVYKRERTDADAVFPAVDGEPGRPRDANILRRDLDAAKLPREYTAPDGTRLPFTFHAMRRTFSRLLGDNGVSPEMVGMLDGHAAKSVTERHYMGRSLEAMARAVASLRLALPARPGVSDRPPESSRESSAPESVQTAITEIPEGFPMVSYEHPIELPQLRHL